MGTFIQRNRKIVIKNPKWYYYTKNNKKWYYSTEEAINEVRLMECDDYSVDKIIEKKLVYRRRNKERKNRREGKAKLKILIIKNLQIQRWTKETKQDSKKKLSIMIN
jgi:hypothetical protein